MYISASDERSTFEEALALCKSKGARLFEPKNAKANFEMARQVREHSRLPFWIGLMMDSDESGV